MFFFIGFFSITKALTLLVASVCKNILECIGCPPLLLRLTSSLHMNVTKQFNKSISDRFGVKSVVKEGSVLVAFGI